MMPTTTDKQKANRRLAAPQGSALVPREGYAVQITRDDGSTFLASSGEGIGSAVWNLGNRKYAARYKNTMRDEGFNAHLVRVIFADPIVQNASGQVAAKGEL